MFNFIKSIALIAVFAPILLITKIIDTRWYAAVDHRLVEGCNVTVPTRNYFRARRDVAAFHKDGNTNVYLKCISPKIF